MDYYCYMLFYNNYNRKVSFRVAAFLELTMLSI